MADWKQTGSGAASGAVSGAATGNPWLALGGMVSGGLSGLLSGDGGPEVDNFFNANAYADLYRDRTVRDMGINEYQYNTINPYGDTPVTPYKSTATGSMGYYYDKKKGVYVDEANYRKKTYNGQKDLGGSVRNRDTGEREDRFVWIPAQLTEEARAGEAASPAALQQQTNQYYSELNPQLFGYLGKYIKAQDELLPSQAAAEKNTAEYTAADAAAATGLIPQKTAATSAGYQYTIDTTPLKTQAVRDALALAGRNTEDEAARMAGAEVAQAFNTKQQSLAENIRRTGAVAGSGRMAGLQEDLDLSRVKATAGARTNARLTARNQQFDQLQRAIQLI